MKSLVDTGRLEVKPITVLLGKNSSGKSTLTRFFPLMRQSVEVPSSVPVLWYGDLVDFGTITDVVSRFSDTSNTRFDLWFPVDNTTRMSRSRYARSLPQNTKEIQFGLTLRDQRDTTKLNSIHFGVDQDIVDIDVSDAGIIQKILANGNDYSKFFPSDRVRIDDAQFVPQILRKVTFNEGEVRWVPAYRAGTDSIRSEIRRIVKFNAHGRMSDHTINNLVRRIRYSAPEDFIKLMRLAGAKYTSWKSYVDRLSRDTKYAKDRRENLRCLYLLADLPEVA